MNIHIYLPGSTVYTCMLNKYGKVEADLTASSLVPEDASMFGSKGKKFILFKL